MCDLCKKIGKWWWWWILESGCEFRRASRVYSQQRYYGVVVQDQCQGLVAIY